MLIVRHYLRAIAWSSDLLYRPVSWLKGRKPFGPDDVDLFCSGYPRSGNHFCAYALSLFSTSHLSFNKPSHIPPLVERSLKQDKPTVIVLRAPAQATISWAIYTGEPLDHCLRYYIQYHRLIWRYRNDLLVTEFEKFTRDLRPTAQALQSKWPHLSFDLTNYDHEQLTATTFSAIEEKEKRQRGGQLNLEQLPSPTQSRNQQKEKLKEQLELPKIHALLNTANQWHQKFQSIAIH